MKEILGTTWLYSWPRLIFLILLFTVLITDAAASCEAITAKVVSVEGTVELKRYGTRHWESIEAETLLCIGDSVRARSQSRAAIRLNNDSMVRLDQKTTIAFVEPQKNGNRMLDFIKGKLHIITRTPVPFSIRTPFVNAGVEGTEFFIAVASDQASITVFEGKVSASNERGNVTLVDHESAIITQNKAPQKSKTIRLVDAVDWALHYPTIIHYQIDDPRIPESLRSQWNDSLNFYHQGKIIEALIMLDSIEQSIWTMDMLIYRANLLLAVGRVDEAEIIIHQIISLDQYHSAAYSLKAMIALVQNDPENALKFANQAKEYDETSPAAYLALSYVHQAYFQIQPAIAQVEMALKLDDKNALAWARLAELQMAMGYLDRALETAQHAVHWNPNLSKTQTVLGFAYLLQIKTQQATDAFMLAIRKDQADPMPRLGLGLTLIREGNLEAGRIQIEIAASLDPLNALVRSYLGKAYFEEKRYSLAGKQFALAKEYDPNDPTPWLYDGIMKQTQNRQAEALRDIEKSILLNNNRAVYRSRLLLDQDQAARGTSLSRIYDDFGFDQRALIQASKSLAFDPTSHSAHRFLSDAYANMPHHDIARASELLQAQLLQPININPVQPRLGAADLNIITGSGPTAAFNEFTPLFERNRPQLVTSGVVGNFGTLGNETILSGIYNRASYSIGQFHYETDGFRHGANLVNNNYDGFFQYALTPKSNIQAEVRYRHTQHGNLLLDYGSKGGMVNPNNVILDGPPTGPTPISFISMNDPALDSALIKTSSAIQREVEQGFARLGANYAIAPQQNLIVSGMYTTRNIGYCSLLSPCNPNQINNPASQNAYSGNGYQFEGQYLFRNNQFNTIIGSGLYHIDRVNQSFVQNSSNAGSNVLTASNDQKYNGYLYSNFIPFQSVHATLGLSYDALSSYSYDVGTFNPKAGLQWDVTRSIRLRAAWFETVKSAIIANQTIEPVQVAGFNQIFDDPSGTKSQRQGIGLDFHLSENIFSGVEVSQRRLRVPTFISPAGALLETTDVLVELNKQQETFYHAYLYWLAHKNLAVRGEFQFENYQSVNSGVNSVAEKSNLTDVQSVIAPASLNYTSSLGLFAKLSGTFVDQKVSDLTGNRSDFFVVDMITGYRFPNRRGMISFEGRNLFDQEFVYRSYNLNLPIDMGSSFGTLPRFIPERTLFMRLTFNF